MLKLLKFCIRWLKYMVPALTKVETGGWFAFRDTPRDVLVMTKFMLRHDHSQDCMLVKLEVDKELGIRTRSGRLLA